MVEETKILSTIRKYFDFLCDRHNARLIKAEIDSNMHGVSAIYVTRYAGLRVSYEPLDGGIFVMIFSLHSGEVPEYGYWYDFVDYLQAIDVDFREKEMSNWLNPDQVQLEIALKHFADYVKDNLVPFLDGDFSKIPIMEQIVRKRSDSV